MWLKDTWTKAWVGVFTVIIMGLLTLAYTSAKAGWEEYQMLREGVAPLISPQAQQMQQQMQQQIQQIAIDIREIKRNSMTITGNSKVLPDGGDDIFMQINTLGKGGLYVEQKTARVTNLTSSIFPSITVPVQGKFQNRDETLLLMISKKAGEMLGAAPGEVFKVRLEPIEEE